MAIPSIPIFRYNIFAYYIYPESALPLRLSPGLGSNNSSASFGNGQGEHSMLH